MTFWRGALAVLTAGLLSSCAIHPLPQDFSGVSTDTIVRQVRCETRNAATNLVLGELQLVMMPGNLKQLPAREADKIEALFNTIRADRDGIDVFNPERDLPGDNLKRVRAYLDVIYSTGVAYNFDLTMSETNNLSAGFDLLGPFAPKFTMGFKADLNRSRGNERTFTLTDKLGDLMARPMKFANGASYCADKLVAKNFIYPITGEVGVSDTINDFFA